MTLALATLYAFHQLRLGVLRGGRHEAQWNLSGRHLTYTSIGKFHTSRMAGL